MHYHSLFKFLKRASSKVEVSTHSAYFTINHHVVRYSNHFSSTSKCDLSIVKVDDTYIITFTTYKTPMLKNNIHDIKIFLNPIFEMWKLTSQSSNDDIPEITEYNNPKIPIKISINKNSEITNSGIVIAQLVEKNMLTCLPNNLRGEIINLASLHPESIDDIADFVVNFGNKSVVRKAEFNKLKKKYMAA